VKYIVVHCSDSPQGRGDTAETIHSWHKEKGWDGVGYHYVILEDGTVENGRPEYWPGSHVRGHNSHSLGICLIGRDRFTTEQMDALRGLLRRLHAKYPEAVIVGHRDLDPSKTCPNFDVRDIVDEVLAA
jgi:N-acetyl-anhydromuramyl-L-alanine amidase AmpD